MSVLTIAGFDPSSGAGVTADLAVFAAHGFFGISAITALTVQSTLGVRAVHPVERPILAQTLEFVTADLPPAGVKIGMLASEDNVLAVVECLASMRLNGSVIPVVLDPVMQSSSGKELLTKAGLKLLRERLLPLVDWVTPNVAELGVLTHRRIETEVQMEDAASKLTNAYPRLNVVATGGHLECANDLVIAAQGSEWLRADKIDSRATHGTGCAFSSSLLCGLVDGLDGVEAARRAKQYVAEAIRTATSIGTGHGPMNLHWPLTS